MRLSWPPFFSLCSAYSVFLSVNMCQLVQFSALLPVCFFFFFFQAIHILAPYPQSTACLFNGTACSVLWQYLAAACLHKYNGPPLQHNGLRSHIISSQQKSTIWYDLNNSKAWPSLLIKHRAVCQKPLTTKKESAPERQNITSLFYMLPAWATKHVNRHVPAPSIFLVVN